MAGCVGAVCLVSSVAEGRVCQCHVSCHPASLRAVCVLCQVSLRAGCVSVMCHVILRR